MDTGSRRFQLGLRRMIEHSLDCARRAGVARFQLAASRPVKGFTRQYDTLVLELKPQPSHLLQLEPSETPGGVRPGAHLLREALLLLQAVSNCRGLSFCENPTFWKEALSLELSLAVLIAPQRFPRVALDWDPHDVTRMLEYDKTTSQRLLQTSVLDLFTQTPPPPLSKLGQKLLAYTNNASGHRPRSPIECVVAIRFAPWLNATKVLVGAVVSAAAASTGRRTHAHFQWVGVRLVDSQGGKCVRRPLLSVATVASLCASLPPALAVEIRLPTSRSRPRALPTESVQQDLATFLLPALGVSATEALGRMVVLDLLYRTYGPRLPPSAIDFASLCTVLPFAPSLRKLCVAVASTSDLVWLLYAVVHPLTRASPWRTLYLEGQSYAPAKWHVAHRLVHSPSMLATLWSLLTRPGDTPAVGDVVNGHGSEHYVRRTARITSDAALLSPDKSTTLAQLTVGTEVELCDTTTAITELRVEQDHADLDDVAVVIAGVGIGWIHKRHLSTITDARFDGRLQPSLTTLTLGGNIATASDAGAILQMFGPVLKHLRLFHSDSIAMHTVVRRSPHLESLELPFMFSHDRTDAGAATTWDLPALRDVGVASNVASLEVCFRMLHTLPALRTVRLLFRTYADTIADWELVDQHVVTLITAKQRTLRHFTLIAPYERRPSTTARRLDHRMRCSAVAKVAFLSVLQAARDAETRGARREDARASLGTDVVQFVFAFAGPSLTTIDVHSDELWPRTWYDSSARWYKVIQ